MHEQKMSYLWYKAACRFVSINTKCGHLLSFSATSRAVERSVKKGSSRAAWNRTDPCRWPQLASMSQKMCGARLETHVDDVCFSKPLLWLFISSVLLSVLCCDKAVLVDCLGLGTKTQWLDLGKDHVLAWNTQICHWIYDWLTRLKVCSFLLQIGTTSRHWHSWNIFRCLIKIYPVILHLQMFLTWQLSC